MYGIDISNYKNDIDLNNPLLDFVIIKGTEGNGYVDKAFHKFAVRLIELDKLIGVYHFARPDLHPTKEGMEDEARWFVRKVKEEGLLHKAILILDWETEPMNRKDLMTWWVSKVYELTSVVPVIYASRSKLQEFKKWAIIQGCPLWMAQWPTIQTRDLIDGIDEKLASRDVKWDIWQYSNNGRIPNYHKRVDLNYTKRDNKWWMETAGHVEGIKESLTDDMKWAIEIGLYSGHSDGTYRPKDPLTREQAASILHKLYDKLRGDK